MFVCVFVFLPDVNRRIQFYHYHIRLSLDEVKTGNANVVWVVGGLFFFFLFFLFPVAFEKMFWLCVVFFCFCFSFDSGVFGA